MVISTTTIQLRTAYGPVYRTVSTAPARNCTSTEIPIIDLANIDGDLSDLKTIAENVRVAAVSIGFFYVKNHGIGEDVVLKATKAAKRYEISRCIFQLARCFI
jgi:hypothetical protein